MIGNPICLGDTATITRDVKFKNVLWQDIIQGYLKTDTSLVRKLTSPTSGIFLRSINIGPNGCYNVSQEVEVVANNNCTTTGIENEAQRITNKSLIRILTPLGQEIKPEQAIDGLFIYQYSDGSVKKVMKNE